MALEKTVADAYACMCLFVGVCVCVCERERERERGHVPVENGEKDTQQGEGL